MTDEDGKVGRTIVFANTKAGLVAVTAADQASQRLQIAQCRSYF